MQVRLPLLYIRNSVAVTFLGAASLSGAQVSITPAIAATPTTPSAASASSPAPGEKAATTPDSAPVLPPTPPTWSLGPMDISGFIDGYYSFNANRPADSANGQVNDLYNFNDKTDQFNLSSAKLQLNHDPDPVGAHIELIYGRTNTLFNNAATNGGSEQLSYIEQAFISLKPPKAKGFELDFGKFVTSAGAETADAKDNWNYSRSLLFVYAIPYWHFGGRASMPVSKTETLGVQVVNGWNNVTKSNGGATVGLNSTYTKTKYVWNAAYYGGPENAETTKGFRNLFDTTLLLTPNAKLNAYINYDYGQNRDGLVTKATGTTGDTLLKHWQGIAVAAHEQVTGTSALTGRFEYFSDPQGSQTGAVQHVKEVTATYEYKWPAGLLARAEYRGDFSDTAFFHKDTNKLVDSQSTITLGLIAFFGPKR